MSCTVAAKLRPLTSSVSRHRSNPASPFRAAVVQNPCPPRSTHTLCAALATRATLSSGLQPRGHGALSHNRPSTPSTPITRQYQRLNTAAAAAASIAADFPLDGVNIADAKGAQVALPCWNEDETVVFALLRHFG
mmetsp:Transcript_19509/g.23383  ORF Transcript_19509/g.23383 Transcript_19509/m.23383 type:complete len:135 (-) Transcript_19509:730-1134(-)